MKYTLPCVHYVHVCQLLWGLLGELCLLLYVLLLLPYLGYKRETSSREAVGELFKGPAPFLPLYLRPIWWLFPPAWRPRVHWSQPAGTFHHWDSTPRRWPPAAWCSPGSRGNRTCERALKGTGQNECPLAAHGTECSTAARCPAAQRNPECSVAVAPYCRDHAEQRGWHSQAPLSGPTSSVRVTGGSRCSVVPPPRWNVPGCRP